MFARLHHLWPALSGLALLLGAQAVLGTTIDMRPRPAILLKGAGRFLAQDSSDSLALYDASNGQALRRFPAGAHVNEFDLTTDERFLLIACADGRLSLWDVASGENVWRMTSRQTGLDFIYDASFASDGKSFVVCNYRDFCVIADTATGEQIGVVRFPPSQTNIMSACLSPDGTKGVLIDLGESVFTFNATTGAMSDAGVKGSWPVRCSADGKYAAFRSSNAGSKESLRVLTLDANPSSRDLTELGYIGRIRPVNDGSFLVTGVGEKGATGVRYDPRDGTVEHLWTLMGGETLMRVDFDPATRRGVYTDYRLVTQLVDLRTGDALLRIDNSENYGPTIMSTTNVFSWSGFAYGAGAVALVIFLVIFLRYKLAKTAAS